MRTLSKRPVFLLAILSTLFLHRSIVAQVVDFQLRTEDMFGNEISEVPIGEPFLLNAYVSDLRAEPKGVYSAYMDVNFPPSIVKTLGNKISFGEFFRESTRGELLESVIDEVGALKTRSEIDVLPEQGSVTEVKLFSVEFMGTLPGNAFFHANPAEQQPRHAVTVFGVDEAIAFEDVRYGSSTIRIVPEPTFGLVALVANAVLLSFVARRQRCG